jgi:hypothetical protein
VCVCVCVADGTGGGPQYIPHALPGPAQPATAEVAIVTNRLVIQ